MLVVAGFVLAACGGGDSTEGAPEPTSPAGQRGEALAENKGCLACHTVTGERSTGPTWQGLAGSEVELADGATVVADDDYLARSITDPRSEVVAGYPNIMPEQDLTTDEVADLLAYIGELSSPEVSPGGA
ncbi:hypothetical protein BH23ACT2_BH23ACT2_18540 [soil metagenome]